MIFKKMGQSSVKYRRKRLLLRVLYVVLCLAAVILGFFAAGPICDALGW